MDEKTTRCTSCHTEFSDAEIVNATHCPTCGSTSVPCDIQEDVTLKINWHELRIITIWASNFASQDGFPENSRRTLEAIISRLENQYPDKTPLTLVGEVRKLQEELPGAQLVQNGKVVVAPKKVQ